MKRGTHMALFLVFLLTSFMPAIARAEEAGRKSSHERAQLLVDKGLALNDNSKQEAEFYRRAIEIDPTYASAYFNLGFLYHSRGELENAIHAYRQCVRYDPRRYEAHRNLAVCLLTVRRDAALYEVRYHLNLAIELQEGLQPAKRSAAIHKQKAELLDLERRIHRVLKPVVRDHYTSEMITRILSRRVTRGGQGIYEGPRLPMLFFDTSSAILENHKETQLHILAEVLNGSGLTSYGFTIEGHADGRGRLALNHRLSYRRAEAMRNWLVRRGGIIPERLKVEYYGEDHPIFPNDSLRNYRYNRRIEIVRRD